MESLVHILLSNALAAAVMAMVVAGVSQICQRPALTHSLWLIILLKLVTPPLVPVSLPGANAIWPVGSNTTTSRIDGDHAPAVRVEPVPKPEANENAPRRFDAYASELPVDLAAPAPDLAASDLKPQPSDISDEEATMPSNSPSGWMWERLVLVVILSGAIGWWTLATVRIIRFQRLLKDVQSVPGAWQTYVDGLAGRVGLGRRPAVCLVPGRVPPMLWAIGGRPRLLVPAQLWAIMNEDERTSLLVHELAHLKRRDHWVRMLELVVAGLYWWHPVVWWARRALREAEEQCCDAWVVWAMPRRARTYAAALLAAVEFVSGAPTAPAAASATSGNGHVSCLKRRLKMIVRAKTPKGLSWVGRIAVLGMAALVLPLAPSWAQKNTSTPAEPNRLTAVDDLKRSTEIQRAHQHTDEMVEDRITEDLRTDPELVALTREIFKARRHLDDSRRANRDFTQSLEQQLVKLQAEIDAKKQQLKELVKKGKVAVLQPQEFSTQPTFKTLSEPQIERMSAEMVQTDLALSDAQSLLEAKLAANEAHEQQDKQSLRTDQELEARIKEEFNKDPDVQTLVNEIRDTRDQLEYTKGRLLHPYDPARRAAQKQFEKLHDQYQKLWETKYSDIRKRLTGTAGAALVPEGIQALRLKVAMLAKKKEKQAALFKEMQAKQKGANDDTFEATYLYHEIASRMNWQEQARKNLEQLKFEAGQEEQRLSDLIAQHEKLRKQKHDQLLALLTKDDDKNDDDKDEKTRDAAERFQEQLTDLIDKLGKQLSPVTEEIRKALDRAVGEVHKSLEKENLSVEDLRKAIEKSQDELRKAFEGGGPVDKELREAIEHSRKELQDALERGKAEVQDQVETLRKQSRELTDRAQDELERAKEDVAKGTTRRGEGQTNREELEAARKEIRDLEQQLRRSTRRLEELERRESRRNPAARRERNPSGAARFRDTPAPGVEPPQHTPQRPAAPAAPSRPGQPSFRRPQPPNRPGPSVGRRGPQSENDKRLQELEEKMNLLLKELKNLKEEKTPKEGKESSSPGIRPAKPGLPITFRSVA